MDYSSVPSTPAPSNVDAPAPPQPTFPAGYVQTTITDVPKPVYDPTYFVAPSAPVIGNPMPMQELFQEVEEIPASCCVGGMTVPIPGVPALSSHPSLLCYDCDIYSIVTDNATCPVCGKAMVNVQQTTMVPVTRYVPFGVNEMVAKQNIIDNIKKTTLPVAPAKRVLSDPSFGRMTSCYIPTLLFSGTAGFAVRGSAHYTTHHTRRRNGKTESYTKTHHFTVNLNAQVTLVDAVLPLHRRDGVLGRALPKSALQVDGSILRNNARDCCTPEWIAEEITIHQPLAAAVPSQHAFNSLFADLLADAAHAELLEHVKTVARRRHSGATGFAVTSTALIGLQNYHAIPTMVPLHLFSYEKSEGKKTSVVVVGGLQGNVLTKWSSNLGLVLILIFFIFFFTVFGIAVAAS